jgi:hypothetical protein
MLVQFVRLFREMGGGQLSSGRGIALGKVELGLLLGIPFLVGTWPLRMVVFGERPATHNTDCT